jgi:hypothetical protein
MTFRVLKNLVAPFAATSLLVLAAAPATLAGPADITLLQSYVGNYLGTGTMSGNPPQKITCRISLQPGNEGKVTYIGRCSTAGANLSMTGVFAFVGNHFEAAMSSTGGMTGTAIGERRGNAIAFTSRSHENSTGHDRTVSSTMTLAGGTIRVDFSIFDSKTHKTASGSIPFSKV